MIYSYHEDQVVSVEDIEKHELDCEIGIAYTNCVIEECTCTPTKGKRIVIEVWLDDAEKVKGENK